MLDQNNTEGKPTQAQDTTQDTTSIRLGPFARYWLSMLPPITGEQTIGGFRWSALPPLPRLDFSPFPWFTSRITGRLPTQETSISSEPAAEPPTEPLPEPPTVNFRRAIDPTVFDWIKLALSTGQLLAGLEATQRRTGLERFMRPQPPTYLLQAVDFLKQIAEEGLSAESEALATRAMGQALARNIYEARATLGGMGAPAYMAALTGLQQNIADAALKLAATDAELRTEGLRALASTYAALQEYDMKETAMMRQLHLLSRMAAAQTMAQGLQNIMSAFDFLSYTVPRGMLSQYATYMDYMQNLMAGAIKGLGKQALEVAKEGTSPQGVGLSSPSAYLSALKEQKENSTESQKTSTQTTQTTQTAPKQSE